MNKKREALRHGLRSFIEDTSRELADLEGREIRPAPPAPAPAGEKAPGNGAGGDGASGPSATAVGAPPAIAPPAIAPHEPRPTPPRPAPAPRVLPAPKPGLKPAPARAPQGRGPKRRIRVRLSLPERVSPEGAEDVVKAAQAHARKGVCFAYFLNQACWRVPEAYCNRALQVCITRECPVYHLHKGALERRFAAKFQHFW